MSLDAVSARDSELERRRSAVQLSTVTMTAAAIKRTPSRGTQMDTNPYRRCLMEYNPRAVRKESISRRPSPRVLFWFYRYSDTISLRMTSGLAIL
ncbi:hypothetical protein CYMTET_29059 [Cymbomonas tetramitiformis]|uniref:Uncharacterized protein n=1 Tax=Cymbomonas tetramitiformis TaxID=36881 RepID=A0AAE0KVA5_9CHLO|nr:hypothetical protein CYMTET_29059 [Cymbomonas tetramitiformis]